jgi:hypothetical protein
MPCAGPPPPGSTGSGIPCVRIRRGRNRSCRLTIRKVLRRLISHDRDHAAEILQRRTWLLLGVPKRGD